MVDRNASLAVYRFDDRLVAWAALHDLHVRDIAYNLVYRPGCLCLVKRPMQGSYVHSAWTAGFCLVGTGRRLYDAYPGGFRGADCNANRSRVGRPRDQALTSIMLPSGSGSGHAPSYRLDQLGRL